MFAITATRQILTADGWESVCSLPTFYLDSRVQGIVSEDHAERIARRMLTDVNPSAAFHITAYRTEENPS